MSAKKAEPEVIEGTAVEVPAESNGQSSALVPVAHLGGDAIALLSDEEFAASLAALKKARDRADQIKEALLKEGVDYGSLPGIARPFLHQPGAETFEKAFHLATSFRIERLVGDGETAADLEFIAHAQVHLGDTSGPIVAEGTGEASSWETKYRYRTIRHGRRCPDCGKETVIKLPAKGNRGEAYWCGTRDGGCGHSFPIGSPKYAEIDRQSVGSEKVENPDPWDLANTLIKMACKRAHVAGILRATGTSGLFTQDDDSPAVRQPPGNEPQNGPSAPGSGPGAPQGGGAPTGPSGPAPGAEAVSGADGPAGLQGVVSDAPDGIRQVRLDGTNPLNRSGGPFDKLELRFKVANRQHTAILLDGLAHAVEVLAPAVGEVVRIIGGEVVEVVWQEGKPKKKELWGATDVAIQRQGTWLGARSTTPTLGFGEAGPQAPSTAPTAASAPAPASSSPTSSPAVAPSPAPTPAGSASSSASTTRKHAADGDVGMLRARLVEPIKFTTSNGRDVGILRLVDVATGELFGAVLGDRDQPGIVTEELGSAAEPAYAEGDVLAVVGTFQNGWLILSGVGRAADYEQGEDDAALAALAAGS